MTNCSTPARRVPASEAGFTLIEALIAIVILSFGLIAVTNLFIVAASSNQIGSYNTATATEASEVMERLKRVPFNVLAPPANTTAGDLTADLPAANFPPALPAEPDVVVAGVPPVPQFNMYRDVAGIGRIRTRWTVQSFTDVLTTPVLLITVRSQVIGPFGGQLSQAQFSTFRTCTGAGCP
jgi:prepilin-type N-terminal cleavage/methylation domain-containing protein